MGTHLSHMAFPKFCCDNCFITQKTDLYKMAFWIKYHYQNGPLCLYWFHDNMEMPCPRPIDMRGNWPPWQIPCHVNWWIVACALILLMGYKLRVTWVNGNSHDSGFPWEAFTALLILCLVKQPYRPVNSGVSCQKQVSRTGTSNYIPQILSDVITCPFVPSFDTFFWLNTPHLWTVIAKRHRRSVLRN